MVGLHARKSEPGLSAVNSAGVAALPFMTYEEFLDWADEDTLAEWVNGEVEITSPASLKHQVVASFLFRIVEGFVRINDSGTVILPPFQMKLPFSGREPDLIFVAKNHLQRLEDVYLAGPADLAVEVVSKENRKCDCEIKFRAYAQGGVPEYWLINPLRKQSKFYQLDEQKSYQELPLDNEGKYYSRALPGFLYAKPGFGKSHYLC